MLSFRTDDPSQVLLLSFTAMCLVPALGLKRLPSRSVSTVGLSSVSSKLFLGLSPPVKSPPLYHFCLFYMLLALGHHSEI